LFQALVTKLSPNNIEPTLATLISLTGKPEQRFPQIEKRPKQLGLLSL
jgi:hypothetical protein